jgi:hypothetical protein
MSDVLQVQELELAGARLTSARLVPGRGRRDHVVAIMDPDGEGPHVGILEVPDPGEVGPPPEYLGQDVRWIGSVRAGPLGPWMVWADRQEGLHLVSLEGDRRARPLEHGLSPAATVVYGPVLAQDGTELVLAWGLGREVRLLRHDLAKGETQEVVDEVDQRVAIVLGLHAHDGAAALLWSSGDRDHGVLHLSGAEPGEPFRRTHVLEREDGDEVHGIGGTLAGAGPDLLVTWTSKGREMQERAVCASLPDLSPRTLHEAPTRLRGHRAAWLGPDGAHAFAFGITQLPGARVYQGGPGDVARSLPWPTEDAPTLSMGSPLALVSEGEDLALLACERSQPVLSRWRGGEPLPPVRGLELGGAAPPTLEDHEVRGRELRALWRKREKTGDRLWLTTAQL